MEGIHPGRAAELRETRLGLRRQLPSNIFVQFLAGPRDIRDGGLGWFLKAVAWISLVIGPVLLLLLLQIQFLPYHLAWVTWVQRFALFADVTLLWFLWPAVLASCGAIQWPRLWRHPVLALLSLVPIGLAFTAATFRGEWLDEHLGKRQWIPPNRVMARLGLPQEDEEKKPIWTSFHDLLFNGKVDLVTRRRNSLFSNTIVQVSTTKWRDALEAEKIDHLKTPDGGGLKDILALRGRHLEGAVFYGADLRKSDLEGAYLQDALLFRAQLQGASLIRASLQGATLQEAQLQGATLLEAQLQKANLDHAQLQGADLYKAQLQGAHLYKAQLQGASLNEAQLQGASLNEAQLQGAYLDQVNLLGASLFLADLQGASVDSASLEGASLYAAQLQGASLNLSRLWGASLQSADLQGASLNGAELQGAYFDSAHMVAVDLRSAKIWRTTFDEAELDKVFEEDLSESQMSKKDFANLKDLITKTIPENISRESVPGLMSHKIFVEFQFLPKELLRETARESALELVKGLNPVIVSRKASNRQVLKKSGVDKSTYEIALADVLKKVAYSDEDIVAGLIRNNRIKDTGAQAPTLAKAILGKDCAGSAAVTEHDKAVLNEIANEASGAL
jgi:uncharacterized protein YjbI with pentapeptide repeats